MENMQSGSGAAAENSMDRLFIPLEQHHSASSPSYYLNLLGQDAMNFNSVVMEGGSTGLSPNYHRSQPINGSNNNEAPIMHNMTGFVANNQPMLDAISPHHSQNWSTSHDPRLSSDYQLNKPTYQQNTVGSHQANMPTLEDNSQPMLNAVNHQYTRTSFDQLQSSGRRWNNTTQQYPVGSHQANMPGLMATSQPILHGNGMGQYSQSLGKPFDQPRSLDRPLNNAIPYQQHTVVGSLPKDSTVAASQHRDLENTREISNTPNLLESIAMQTGSLPQSDREKDINVQLRLNDNQIPSGDMYQLEVTVHPFVAEVSRKLPIDSWKSEIIKEFIAQLETISIESTNGTWKATIGKKRTTLTVSSDESDSDQELTLKRKIAHDSTYYSKTQIFGDSNGMSRATIKSSANAHANATPSGRNRTACGLTRKSTFAASSPRMEGQNLEISAHQISESRKRQKPKFSGDQTQKLIDAVGKYGVGKWQRILSEVFNGSHLTSNDLKGRWRSLVTTAERPPETRRSGVSKQLLEKVKEINEAHKRTANHTAASSSSRGNSRSSFD